MTTHPSSDFWAPAFYSTYVLVDLIQTARYQATKRLHLLQHNNDTRKLQRWLLKYYAYRATTPRKNLKSYRNLRNSQYEISVVKQLFLMTLWVSLVLSGHLFASDWLGSAIFLPNYILYTFINFFHGLIETKLMTLIRTWLSNAKQDE